MLHENWTERITQEMYNQGDQEQKLGLTISAFMDRHQDDRRAKHQIGEDNCDLSCARGLAGILCCVRTWVLNVLSVMCRVNR